MSGLVNPNMVIPYTVTPAVSDAGYLVYLTGVDTVALCTAAATPVGYTFTSSLDASSNANVAGKKIGITGLVWGTVAELQLAAANSPITVSQYVAPTAGGCVNAHAANATGWVVGKALETKAASAGGTIKVLIMPVYNGTLGKGLGLT